MDEKANTKIEPNKHNRQCKPVFNIILETDFPKEIDLSKTIEYK